MAKTTAKELLNSVKGTLPQSVERLEVAARALPTGTDFHFYHNFPQFTKPLHDVTATMSALLSRIGTARELRTETAGFVDEPDEVYDWLIAMQDDLLEKVDGALDEFQKARNERKRRKGPDFDEIFQDTRKKGKTETFRDNTFEETQKLVKIAKRGNEAKGYVPTYIKSIPRPQDKFDVEVDNSNTPFRHPSKVVVVSSGGGPEEGESIPVALIETGQKQVQADLAKEGAGSASTTGSERSFRQSELDRLQNYAQKLQLIKAAHPLDDVLRSLEYKDGFLLDVEPQEPLPLLATRLTFVDTLDGLKDLAVKLSASQEFAVDLEHHHYRSFQGFVCIMQVSTRAEDFIVDTLALRSHIGPCLGGIFSNSNIKKVMHGADSDVVWLQRDFGIYLCNLFDTGQATRVLEFPSFGLAFLLQHFCNISADKRYQLADWRLRPLTPDMLRYAREDTHYLLYVYDKLRQLLIADRAEKSTDPLLQVFELSREVCLKLYEKDLVSDTSHLQLYGLLERNLRPLQLGVLAELYAWRDQIARKEDESTGFVCPNRLLIQLAEQMPENLQDLQKLAKGARSLVLQWPATILSIIRTTKENFISKMSLVDAESCKNSKPSGCPKPPMQSEREEGRCLELQELDGNLSSEGGTGCQVVGSGADVTLVSTAASSLEVLLHGETAAVKASLADEISVNRTGAAIVRRSMVSSIFGPLPRAPTSSRSVQGLQGNDRNPGNSSTVNSSDTQCSHLSNLPAENDKTGSVIEGMRCGLTGSDSLVAEQSIGAQVLEEQLQDQYSDLLVQREVLLAGNGGHTAGRCRNELRTTLSEPGELLVEVEAPELVSAALPVGAEADCFGSPAGNEGCIPLKECDPATDCPGHLQDNSSPHIQMEHTVANTGSPSVECVAMTNSPLGQSSWTLRPESAAGGFISLLGRPPRKSCKSNEPEDDEELVEGRRKAEEIKSLVTLPFHGNLIHLAEAKVAMSHTVDVAKVLSSITVLDKPDVKASDKTKMPVQEPREWGEVMSFESGDDSVDVLNDDQQMHDKGDKEGRKRVRESEGESPPHSRTVLRFPRPLSATSRFVGQGNAPRGQQGIPRFHRDSWNKVKTGLTQGAGSSKSTKKHRKSFQLGSMAPVAGGVEIPFDYEAAKKELGVEAELNRTRGADISQGKAVRKEKKSIPRPSAPQVFDPYRNARTEPKAEGIRPASRRQVFPQSGNRSANFK